MKKILLIGTGGTIASLPSPEGLVPSLSAERLIKLVPELKGMCSLQSIDLINMDSTNICPEHWLKIAECIRNNYSVYDGFVITHGTDTLAYTAAGLSYLFQNIRKPIVITGAQIPLIQKNSDAERNLLDSFLYVCDDQSYGVNIVFSGAVILGTRARKNYSKRFDAFCSVNYPEVARIQGNKIFRFISEEPKGDEIFYEKLNSNVGILKLTPGLRKDILQYLLNSYDGLVIESFGVGGIPEYSDFFSDIQAALKKGKIVVLTTQVPNEGSDLEVYRVGKILKQKTSVIEAYDMTTESALAKLMWCLGQTSDVKEIHSMFYKSISHDILQ